VAEFCGDNIINNNDENCEDGNTVDGDGCDNNCQTEVCGNGVPQVGEECDDGNTESGDGCSSTCVAEFCGDNIINNNDENCEDGNTVDGDGCDNNCQTEVCGNGVPQVGEECDDGNTESVDGCTSSCMYEQCPKSMDTGWSNACAVTSDGGVSFWGQMSVQMPKGSGAKACATQATGQPVCVLFDTGDVKCWSSSQFSNITLGGKKAVQLECDQFGCCALLENNYLQCFNVRFFLQYFTQFVPDGGHHLGDVPVVQVATLRFAVCVVFADGSARCWGNSYCNTFQNGQHLDLGVDSNSILSLSAGSYKSICALLTRNRVKCWGCGSNGALGRGSDYSSVSMTDAKHLTPIQFGTDAQGKALVPVEVSGGEFFYCVRFYDLSVKCWGQNARGQLGHFLDSTASTTSPVSTLPIVELGQYSNQVLSLSVGPHYACAGLSNGEVKCWGAGSRYELGFQTSSDIGYLRSQLPQFHSQASVVMLRNSHRLSDFSAEKCGRKTGCTPECQDNAFCSIADGNPTCACLAGFQPVGTGCTHICPQATVDGIDGVQCGDYTFATIDRRAPDDPELASQASAHTLPRGWALVPADLLQDVVPNVVSAYSWGTQCLVFANGICYPTSLSSNGNSFSDYLDPAYSPTVDSYNVHFDNARVLMYTTGCGSTQDNNKYYSSRTACTEAGACDTANEDQYYDFPGYDGSGSCRIGGTCSSEQGPLPVIGETYTDTAGSGSCSVASCPLTLDYGELYKTAGDCTVTLCEEDSGVTQPGPDEYFSAQGSCDISKCNNAAVDEYYSGSGDPGDSASCDVEYCNSPPAHMYFSAPAAGGTTADSCSTNDCTNSPPTNEAYSPTGRTVFTATDSCVFECAAGYWRNSITGICEECPAGLYKDVVGDGECNSTCVNPRPLHEEYVSSPATDSNECDTECLPGYYRDGSSCQPCATGYYKTEIGDGACTVCPSQINTGTGVFRNGIAPADNSEWITAQNHSWTAVAQCNLHCDPGYTLSASGCVECDTGSFKTANGNDACTQCPSGVWMGNNVQPPNFRGPALVDNAVWARQTFGQSLTGWTANWHCLLLCEAGYYLVDQGGGVGSCEPCPAGTFKSGFGTDEYGAAVDAGRTPQAAKTCMPCESQSSDFLSRPSLPSHASWTYDFASVPTTASDQCTWACKAGFGAVETRSGSSLLDVTCAPCAEAHWNEAPSLGTTYVPCSSCLDAGLGKPPNSEYTYKGTAQSGESSHDGSDTACAYECNPDYDGVACNNHGNCLDGEFYNPAFDLLGGNGSCLKFYEYPLPFAEAREACIADGYDIAIIRSAAENTLFGYARDTWAWLQEGASPARTFAPPMTYHGLTDRVTEGTWYFVNSYQRATWLPWGGGTFDDNQVNGEDCAVMDGGPGEGYWADVPCNSMRPFVCAIPHSPGPVESCPEAAALACPSSSYCEVQDDVPRCVCQEGFVGDGLLCSGEGWTVKTSIWIRELDGLTLSGEFASGTRKLDTWESQNQEFASLLFPRGYRTGGNNQDDLGPRRLLQTEGAETLPGIPAGFLTSMEHNVVTLSDLLNSGTEGFVLSNGWKYDAASDVVTDINTPTVMLEGVPPDALYLLTVNAIFANRSDAEAALQELLFNLAYNQTFNQDDLVIPNVFGIPLTPDRYVQPRIYRWVAPTTSAALDIKPTGMTVESVFFEPSCEESGCWVVDVIVTTGEDNFNTFYLPEAVGNDATSYDFDYTVLDTIWTTKSPARTFLPVNFPCGSDDYDPSAPRDAPGSNAPLNAPDAVTGCCIPEFIDMYRPTEAFVAAMANAGISKESCDTGLIPIFDRPRYIEPYGDLVTPPKAPFSGPEGNCTTLGLAGLVPEIDAISSMCYDGSARGSIEHLNAGAETLAWVMAAPQGAGAMEIIFNFFETTFDESDLEASDWVTIYACDSGLTSCSVLATGSGAYNRFSVTSCTGTLVVTFVAAGASAGGGFTATYSSLARCPYATSGKTPRAPTKTVRHSEDETRVASSPRGLIPMPGNQLYGLFRGMNHSYAQFREVVDPFIGQYRARIILDEVELRRNAGMLKGTVGVEHTVDTFIGLANFKPSGIDFLDPFATQANLHLEKTSFFSVSTHGVNAYTFLEYVNMRLVSVLIEDSDFSGDQDSNGNGDSQSGNRTVRTSGAGDAVYVQVTFTMGSQYQPNRLSGGLVPLDSVRAGLGTFFAGVDSAGRMEHVCDGYYDSMLDSDNLGLTYNANQDTKENFEKRIAQPCGPKSNMCLSPESTPDSFVSFNIPLGFDVLDGMASSDLSNNVFVSFVVNALDTDSNVGGSAGPTPNEGDDPTQMKTTLTASIPIVAGGINIFCDGVTAKTDLKDVANVDIVVGTANSTAELSRLRIIEDIASTDLASEPSAEINTDSIESALMTLVLKGDHSYFNGTGRNTLDYTMELDDVISIHLMVDGDGRASNSKEAELLRLLALPGDDNSNSTGLDTNGYALNGAFSFTIDRDAAAGASLASLQPSPDLMAVCPFNPPRPAADNMPLESCITRRDVRNREYPNRNGAPDTAMEILASSSPKDSTEAEIDTLAGSLAATSAESLFLTDILGNSVYTKDLAVAFAKTIHARYNLNGRYRRAYWINPGYEWTPTQTDGRSVFTVSQKVYLFALVTLDENWSRRRRRMLLQTSTDALQENAAGMNSASVAFDVSPRSMMAKAFDVPEDRVATFEAKLSLTYAEACMEPPALQAALRETLDDYVQTSISEYHTLQVTTLSVDRGDVQCDRRSSPRTRALSSAVATVTMLLVFQKGGESQINIADIATRPGVQSITPLTVSRDVNTAPPAGPIETPAPGSSEGSSSSDVALIGGIAGGIAGLVLVVLAVVLYTRSKKAEEQIAAVQTININDLKGQLAEDV